MKGFPYVFLNTGRTDSCSPGPSSGRCPTVVTRAACPARPARTPVGEATRTPLPDPRPPCRAMAMFVHLTSAANAPRIRRSGVRTAGRGPAGARGVHCFPCCRRTPSPINGCANWPGSAAGAAWSPSTRDWTTPSRCSRATTGTPPGTRRRPSRPPRRYGGSRRSRTRGGRRRSCPGRSRRARCTGSAGPRRRSAGGICRTRTAGRQHGSTAAQSPAAREPWAPEPGRPRSTAAALPGRPAASQSGHAAARRPWRIARCPGSPCGGTRAAERAAAVNRPRISRAWRGWRCGRGRAGRARPCGCGPPPGSPRRTRRRGRTPATARATACAAGRWPRTSRPRTTACW